MTEWPLSPPPPPEPGAPTPHTPTPAPQPAKPTLTPATQATPSAPQSPWPTSAPQSQSPGFAPNASAPTSQGRRATSSRAPLYFLLASVALLLIAVVVLALTLLIGPGKKVAEHTDSTSPSSQAGESAPTAETTAAGSSDPDAPSDRASGLAAVEQNPCSDAADITAHITAYATEASTQQTWDTSVEQALRSALERIDSSCSKDFVLDVQRKLLTAASVPELHAIIADYSWITPARPAPSGAINAVSFTTPANNIRCRIEDSNVACSIYAYDYPSPGQCEGLTATYEVTHDGETTAGCDYSVMATDIYDYGTAVSAQGFACTLEENGVTCWSELSGHGFTLKRATDSIF